MTMNTTNMHELIWLIGVMVIIEIAVYVSLRLYANKHEASILNKAHGVRDICFAVSGMFIGVLIFAIINFAFD